VKACAVVPVYDHGDTVAGVLDALAKHDLPCIVIDDGSHPKTAAILDTLAHERADVELLRLQSNQGKGMAVRLGLERAGARGFSHALLIDADGQHAGEDVGRFLEASRQRPDALVLGKPVFDASAPRSRRYGRWISNFWAWLETLSFAIGDPLCGYRCVPLAPTLALLARRRVGARMDFDPELAVRLVWDGVPVVNLATQVRYPPGGLSHFDPVRDNLRLAWLNARLFFGMLARAPRWARARLRPAEASHAWDRLPERGSMLGLRLGVLAYRLVGRWLAVVITELVVAYFFLSDGKGRRNSLRYLQRLFATPEGRAGLGGERTPGLAMVWRHYRAFGRSILDRIEIWLGQQSAFHLEFEGRHHLLALVNARRGALLLGSHLGSFDVLRLLARRNGIAVNVLMYTRHAARINAFFRELSPDASLRVIELDPNTVEAVFEIRRRIHAGEFVAILADRPAPGGHGRSIRVPFLGAAAPFPEGCFELASVLGCPVLSVTALRHGPRHYVAYGALLSEGAFVPRAERPERTRALALRYAEVLEHHCRAFPLQWFNFVDFWEEERVGPD
jgi:predicted LPLAT superfamily acyltransferase